LREFYDSAECEYIGTLAPICKAFIAEKRGVGYSYQSEAEMLSVFSRFSEGFDIAPNTLPEEVVKAWIAPRMGEADRTRYNRFSIIHLFAEYMVRMGYHAYIPAKVEAGKQHKTFVPYIFTHSEIQSFFRAVDSMQPWKKTSAPRRHLVMPVLFRLLYCCGLRVSEAAKLRGEDVDLNNGVLTIRDSKFGKSRYVPMSEELTAVCRQYAKTRLVGESDDWFLPARDGGYYGSRSIYTAFRELLGKARIPHGGRGKGPRIHDLRHTFAVHCLQKWVACNAEITTALPHLMEYLGHANISATEQYLRMTAEVYPQISSLVQQEYGYIIPSTEVEQ
jgi:integrase